MADEQKNPNNKSSSSSSSSSGEINGSKGGGGFSGQKPHYPNQRETSIPDAATLRDQWKFAIRQYSKWNSHAWGAAIFAGASLYALGWIIKGSNPLSPPPPPPPPPPGNNHKIKKMITNDDASIDHLNNVQKREEEKAAKEQKKVEAHK